MVFKAGDIVRLKTGGPTMTVSYVDTSGCHEGVRCVWFVSNTRQQGDFSCGSLEVAEADPASVPD